MLRLGVIELSKLDYVLLGGMSMLLLAGCSQTPAQPEATETQEEMQVEAPAEETMMGEETGMMEEETTTEDDSMMEETPAETMMEDEGL